MFASKNQEIADIFNRIADALEFKGENPFRVNAYRKASRVIAELPTDIETIQREGKLRQIPGIGEGIAKKIEEYLTTGQIKKLAEVMQDIPAELFELLKLQGVGPKTLALVYYKLKVKNLDDLKRVIEDGSLAKLPMMGEKKVENLSRSLALMMQFKGRILLGVALPLVEKVINELKKNKDITQATPAGSLRRMCETVGDIDILVSGQNPHEIIKYFTQLPFIKEVVAAGKTKVSVITTQGFQIDLRVIEESSYGAALQYFTGSKAHNIKLRTLAKAKGLKINEYGVFRGNQKIAGATEEEVYKILGLPWIPPELREDRGEIEAAIKNKLPKLVEYNDLKGNLHIHSNYTDGKASIETIAKQAQKLGYEYILITDHSQAVRYANGLTAERLLTQLEEISNLNKKLKGIKILTGIEVDILANGKLDLPDEILERVDLVVAAIHTGFKQRVTERIISAMENPNVDIIAHPTGRLISTREGYENLDLDKIFAKASQTETILEINAFPDRLDLNDINSRRAKEFGVKFVIGTDSHHLEMLNFNRFGIAVARRAWLTKKDILNTYSWEELLA